MKSTTLPLYRAWLATATPEQIEFVDSVYEICERNYEAGGDMVVECVSPEEVLKEFTSLDEVKETCLLHVEQEQNARWGEDSDPKRPEWKD